MKPVPLDLAGHAFLIANTKVPRKLQESKYNERRSECEEALAILQGASSDFAMKRKPMCPDRGRITGSVPHISA